MTPEGRVKTSVKDALRAAGLALFADLVSGRTAYEDVEGFFYMPVAGPYSVLGIHDFVGCWRGVFFSIETKAPLAKEDATPHQTAFHKAANVSGGVSLIGVRDAAAVDELRKRVMEITSGRVPD